MKTTAFIVLLLLINMAMVTRADTDPATAKLRQVTEKLKTGRPLVFATFGDSITLPCYHTDYRQNYITFAVDTLRKTYPKANVRIVHAGNMGSTDLIAI